MQNSKGTLFKGLPKTQVSHAWTFFWGGGDQHEFTSSPSSLAFAGRVTLLAVKDPRVTGGSLQKRVAMFLYQII